MGGGHNKQVPSQEQLEDDMQGAPVGDGGIQLRSQQEVRDCVFSTELLLQMRESGISIVGGGQPGVLLPEIRPI